MLGGGVGQGPVSVTYLYGFHSKTVDILPEFVATQMGPETRLYMNKGLDPDVVTEAETFFVGGEERPEGSLRHILIVDDLGMEVAASPAFTTLLTQGTHHRQITILIISHALFHEGKERRMQHLQSSYTILFKSPRALSSVKSLAGQMQLSGQAIDSGYRHISEFSHQPLILDYHKDTPPSLSILSHVLPEDEKLFVYTA